MAVAEAFPAQPFARDVSLCPNGRRQASESLHSNRRQLSLVQVLENWLRLGTKYCALRAVTALLKASVQPVWPRPFGWAEPDQTPPASAKGGASASPPAECPFRGPRSGRRYRSLSAS